MNQVVPRFRKSDDGIFLIIVSSYLEFVRLRNYFKSERDDFIGLSEYSKSTIEAITKFKKRGSKFLLYTERHYFYNAYVFYPYLVLIKNRTPIRDFKVNQVVFYTLPENSFFYQTVAGRMGIVKEKYAYARVLSLFSVFDALKLERIVGTKRCKILLEADQSTHLLETG